MDNLNKVLENVMSLVPKKHKKLVNEDNLITFVFFLTAIYIYQKKELKVFMITWYNQEYKNKD